MNVKSLLSQQQWQTRIDLAACYRMIAHYDWDDLVFTHIFSARVKSHSWHKRQANRWFQVHAQYLRVLEIKLHK